MAQGSQVNEVDGRILGNRKSVRSADSSQTRLTISAGLVFFLLAAILVSCGAETVEPEPPGKYASDGYGRFSPDGKYIVFRRVHWTPENSSSELLLYDIANDTTSTVPQPVKIRDAHWSPDSRWLTFELGRQIWIMKLNGDSLRQMTFDNGENFFPRWSPCGTKIAFTKALGSDRGVHLIDVATGERKLVSLFGFNAAWIIDCRHLVFNSYKFRSSEGAGQIAICDTVGNQDSSVVTEMQVADTRNCAKFDIAASPGGEQFAIALGCSPIPRTDLWIVERDGNRLRKLTDFGGDAPDWSPDGEWIIFTRHNQGLWLIRPDGSGLHPLFK